MKHFKCNRIKNVKTYDSFHLSYSLLSNDIMNSLESVELVKWSSINNSFLKSTGEYVADERFSNINNWGKGKGCEFLIK